MRAGGEGRRQDDAHHFAEHIQAGMRMKHEWIWYGKRYPKDTPEKRLGFAASSEKTFQTGHLASKWPNLERVKGGLLPSPKPMISMNIQRNQELIHGVPITGLG